MNYKLKEQKLVNLQLLEILGFITSLIISYILTYDKKLSMEKKKRIFDNKTAQNLSLFQTILVFVITITFLYITYSEYIISKNNKKNNICMQENKYEWQYYNEKMCYHRLSNLRGSTLKMKQ